MQEQGTWEVKTEVLRALVLFLGSLGKQVSRPCDRIYMSHDTCNMKCDVT